ncbi:N-acetyltransferase [Winogradskyella ursingii]|uniref:N-acetyltransferase n=1 Tax=Winogradskyella ursingii TaxID=2686079 RepID=UPI0015CCE9ED|nr:N-acetyltransferase [Winogradskyella ursingii]
MTETAELIDNEFLRQFELKVGEEMAIIEYSLQERKIFLTKMAIPDVIKTDEFELEFIDMVFSNIKERNISVVPTSPEIAKFVKRNRKYKRMLPVGIRI